MINMAEELIDWDQISKKEQNDKKTTTQWKIMNDETTKNKWPEKQNNN